MAHELASLLATDVDNVTWALLGKPSSLSRNEIRYGRHGSLAIVREGPKRGAWFDHESGEGGDLIALIMRVHGVNFHRALDIARAFLGGLAPVHKPLPKPAHAPHNASDDAERRQAFAVARWQKRRSYRGSPAQRYLLSRGLDVSVAIDLDHVLGWAPDAHAMVALMTDPVTVEPCGIHRTFLDRDAHKIERKMLGKQGVIRISPDYEVVEAIGICEGVEDALAILDSGWNPIWAATSAGAIARFPVLRDISSITIFSDTDPVGSAAANKCASRWAAAGRECAVVAPGSNP
ncbi:hypothetical protein Hden_1737 [Hyphomicrobium denitrificans ATCC 51888]|uniref:Uncharacterized protein n=1 Tax=Hyphomicrobium denitrificans (strain ATCC 51888 / DSM 1869 / NCIMB 11706 / TK 0415) TaxID=582899 RepID=D8JYU2_HYPDA|nr:toprim domain-containing protein [Hyphomicrobium denitrificans]ADJ23544.1 hypothetical protein Hden_1737 [Hyphomicrobium denitrificans ATCC 51888]